MVEFDELDEDDVRNQIVTISNELRAVRDRSTLVLEGATRILLDLIRKVEPFNEECLARQLTKAKQNISTPHPQLLTITRRWWPTDWRTSGCQFQLARSPTWSSSAVSSSTSDAASAWN